MNILKLTPENIATSPPLGFRQRLSGWIEDLKFRIRGASKQEASLSLLNGAAKLYWVYFSFWATAGKYITTTNPTVTIGKTEFALGIVATVYIVVHPFIPKGSSKWEKEEARRIQMLSVALANMATAINEGACTDKLFQEIVEGTLGAIKSEIETLVGDSDAIHINVSLLIEHEQDHRLLKVIARAQKNRRNRNLPKEEAIVWRAMKNKSYEYAPDFEQTDKDYKCILAYPVLLDLDGDRSGDVVVGGVTIDSSQKYHFNTSIEKIGIRMLPYLQMLALALALRKASR